MGNTRGIVAAGVLALTAVAAAALAATAPPARSQSETIKIVSSLPRGGRFQNETDSIVNAFRMALEEAGYMANGFRIEYEDLDDYDPERGSWSAAREHANASSAVSDPDVMVYLGTFNSGAAKISIPILNRASLAMISPANTYWGLTKTGVVQPNEPDVFYPTGVRNYTRVTPADDLQGAAGAVWAKQIGVQRVYILDDTELFGHGIALVFAKTARTIGLDVVGGPEGIDVEASDYRALASKIRGINPDLVYFGGITQNKAGKLLQDLRAVLGNEFRFMGPEGLYEQAFLDNAGEAAEGAYITFGGVPPRLLTGRGADWYAAYRATYAAEPEAYAAYGYEAMQVALDAIRRAGVKDREAIRAAIFATENYEGVLGTWSFDANGDTTLTAMSGQVVTKGRFDDENAIVINAE